MSQPLVQKPSQKSGHEHWNRLPDSVLHDKRLSASARCVYAELAGCVHQGTVATVGQRRVAARLGFSKNTVTAAVAELAKHGHVKIAKRGNQRYQYHLASEVFGQKQAAGVEEVVSYPRKRLVSVRKTA